MNGYLALLSEILWKCNAKESLAFGSKSNVYFGFGVCCALEPKLINFAQLWNPLLISGFQDLKPSGDGSQQVEETGHGTLVDRIPFSERF